MATPSFPHGSELTARGFSFGAGKEQFGVGVGGNEGVEAQGWTMRTPTEFETKLSCFLDAVYPTCLHLKVLKTQPIVHTQIHRDSWEMDTCIRTA